MFVEMELDDEKTILCYNIENDSVPQLEVKAFMKIFIKTNTNKVFNLEVEPNYTIATLKDKIKNKEGIPLSNQKLSYVGFELNDGKTLLEYNIKEDSTIYLEIAPQLNIQVFVKTVTNEFIVEVSLEDTIKNVKVKIESKEGTSFNNQSLMYLDTEMKDEQTLKDYGVHDFCTIFVVKLFQISLNMFLEKTVKLDVKSNDTIETLKTSIKKTENISFDNLQLFFNGIPLSNGKTISSYYIRDGSTINVKWQDIMQIFINSPSGEIITQKVKSTDTIESLKTSIQNTEGFHFQQQELFYIGEKLDDKRTFSYYNIKDVSTIDLIVEERNVLVEDLTDYKMQIHVVTLNLPTPIILEVNSNDTITNIKTKIQADIGTVAKYQVLIFDGRILEDGQNLSYYGVENGSVLFLRPPSGTHGRKVPYIVELCHTVRDLQNMIKAKQGIPVSSYRIFVEGRSLDEGILLDYDIREGSLLHIIMHMNGC